MLVEFSCRGRVLRLRLSRQWRFWLACCAGCLVCECGPLTVQAHTRRMSWADLDAKVERSYQRKQRGAA